MITSVLPAALYTDTRPPAPTLTVTPLALVSPGPQLMLEVAGWACPDGQMVSNEPPVVPVTVTLRATAAASAGTPKTPATCTSRVPGPHGFEYEPTAGPDGRESWTRIGARPWNSAPSSPNV